MVNVLPRKISESVLEARKGSPELFEMDEQALSEHLRLNNKAITPTDNRLRLQFWLEYERAMMSGKTMNVMNVFAGICSKDYFYNRFIENRYKVSWMLMPPSSYNTKTLEGLEYGIDQFREILSEPLKDPVTKKIDYKLLTAKIKITSLLKDWAKGATVQKTESKVVTVSANLSEVKELALELSTEELERRIKEFDRADKREAALEVKKNV